MKKIGSILMMIVFVLSLSVSVLGAGATSGTCGENATWNYDTYTCTLTISGSGNLNDYTLYTDEEAPWYDYRLEVKKVVINEGVKTMLASAALTYVAGVLASALQILRLVLMFTSRDD